MKLFTVGEANELLPTIIPRLYKIRELYARLDVMRDDARAAADRTGWLAVTGEGAPSSTNG